MKYRNTSFNVIIIISFVVIILGLGFIFKHNDNGAPVGAGLAEGCKIFQNEAPKIIMDGATEAIVVVGREYVEPPAKADDSCEIVKFERSGEVDTNTVGDYTIIYTAKNIFGRINKAKRVVHVINPRGTVYLTFDDGPSPYTARLLDVLAKYGVKATFFVTCAGDDNLILREFNDGHTVALHTCTHNYSYVYSSVANYFDDLYSVQKRVKDITGYTPTLMRFPGGSSNLVSRAYDGGTRIMSTLVNEVGARGFTYFDWNVSSGDAGNAYSSEAVFENVVYALKDGGSSVVLQHDTKDFSVDAVEQIILYGLNNGYVFARLEAGSFTAHHGVNN